jgi:hypothetical protein
VSTVIYELDELQECCDKWVRILKLNNWDIMLSIERGKNFDDMDNCGEVVHIMTLGVAVIKILHPDDWPDDCAWEYDMEKTLVHELLHLHFVSFEPQDKDSLNYTMWERTIETLAKILVDLERAGDTEIHFELDPNLTEELSKEPKLMEYDNLCKKKGKSS